MINVIIYESSSFGGCFEYAKFLIEAYKKNPEIKSVTLLLPRNAKYKTTDCLNILADDSVGKGRFHFIFRNFYNPLRFLFFLMRRPKSFVLLNDFEQISAPLWVPLYKIFLRKHIFAVVLHDPDRDNYPPSKAYSTFCMKKMMSIMKLALYHGHLPDKVYYNGNFKTLAVPCGIFQTSAPDKALLPALLDIESDVFYMSIIGNIRKEKNYDLAIRALPTFPNIRLLIAGAPANSGEDIAVYKNIAKELDVENRIIWIEKFLNDEEMATIIDLSNVILLNYSKTFTSQSGVLNLIAPFQKEVVISKAESSLYKVAQEFKLGQMVEPDDLNSLIEAIDTIYHNKKAPTIWNNYLSYASWDNHVQLVIREIKVLTGDYK